MRRECFPDKMLNLNHRLMKIVLRILLISQLHKPRHLRSYPPVKIIQLSLTSTSIKHRYEPGHIPKLRKRLPGAVNPVKRASEISPVKITLNSSPQPERLGTELIKYLPRIKNITKRLRHLYPFIIKYMEMHKHIIKYRLI